MYEIEKKCLPLRHGVELNPQHTASLSTIVVLHGLDGKEKYVHLNGISVLVVKTDLPHLLVKNDPQWGPKQKPPGKEFTKIVLIDGSPAHHRTTIDAFTGTRTDIWELPDAHPAIK
jgi:hypothetical protein